MLSLWGRLGHRTIMNRLGAVPDERPARSRCRLSAVWMPRRHVRISLACQIYL
jgi:hypothetical protein